MPPVVDVHHREIKPDRSTTARMIVPSAEVGSFTIRR
jgi:hypothetical protein